MCFLLIAQINVEPDGPMSGIGTSLPSAVLTVGCFYCNPKGNVHGPAIAHEETVVMEIYDGPHYPVKPSWYADERDAH
jgi:hypothetical protein